VWLETHFVVVNVLDGSSSVAEITQNLISRDWKPTTFLVGEFIAFL